MSSLNEIDKFKFNGSNYQAFRGKLMDFLLLNDLDRVVLDGLPLSSSSEYSNKLKQDAKAKAHIRLKLSDKICQEVQDEKTAKDILALLDKLYGRKNLVSLGMLEEKYNSRKFKENEKLQDYLKDLNHLMSEINSHSATPTIKASRHAVRILNGLSGNSSYKTVVSSLYSEIKNKGDDVNVDDVTTRLLDENELFQLDSKASQKAPSGTAMKANKWDSKKGKGPFQCYCCGSSDPKHKCEKKHCIVCGKLGCLPSTCPEKFDDKKSQKKVSMMALGSVSKVDKKNVFYLDSACSHHISTSASILFDYQVLESPELLETAKEGVFIELIGKGKVRYAYCGTEVEISDVYYSPESNANLFSSSVFDDKGAMTLLGNKQATLKTGSGGIFMKGVRCGPLYKLDIRPEINPNAVQVALKVSDQAPKKGTEVVSGHCFRVSVEDLHLKLGHANIRRVRDVARVAKIELTGAKDLDCVDCAKGKATRDSFKGHSSETVRPLELVHSDVGFVDTKSYEGYSCFSVFIDDYSKFTVAFAMSSKGQAADCYKKYAAIAQAKFNSKISVLRVDDGKEYKSGALLTFCAENGTVVETTDGYTPELNGVSERAMRTIVEMMRTNLISSGLPKELWDEALFYSVHTINLLPFRGTDDSPYHRWTGRKAHFEKLHRFGALAVKHVPKETRKKLDAKGVECVFVGYDKTGFRLFMPATHRIACSRHVRVMDKVAGGSYFECLNDPSNDKGLSFSDSDEELSKVVSDNDINWDFPVPLSHFLAASEDSYLTPSETDSSQVQSNESSQVSHVDLPSVPQGDLTARPRNLRNLTRRNYALYSAASVKVPATYEEAMASPFREEWKASMETELSSLKAKGTWELCEAPEKANIIKNRWVFSLKTDSFGNVIKFKARLTAKGYSQIHGYDYDETHAPVPDYTSVRLFFALVVLLCLLCDQLDINSAFLNSLMQFLCYMSQPQGFNDGTARVLRLLKTIYGLKQGAHDWYETLREHLKSMGFKQFKSEPCLFVLRQNKNYVFLLVWVDDILVASNDGDLLKDTKVKILNRFEGKDYGPLNDSLFLNWTVKRTGMSMYLNQRSLAHEIVQDFGLQDCSFVPSPGVQNVVLGLKQDKMASNFEYRSAVGSLFHLVNCTRPDLSFSVSYASRFQSDYGNAEVTAVKRIIQYLKSTKDLGLFYVRNANFKEFELETYVDASHAPQGEKSTTGFVIFLNGNPISWKTQKQSITAKSSGESEYVALSTAVSELVFIYTLLEEFGFQVKLPLQVFEDNTTAIKIASKPVQRSRVKHVHLHHHFVKDYVDLKLLQVQHISSEFQLADLFTKNLSGHTFQRLVKDLNLQASD
jgi:transposase InsO family protein